MKSHALRVYVVSLTLLVFFVLWAAVAAKPWAARAAATQPGLDPRLAALDARERRLKRESRVVNRTLERRWRDYRRRLRAREAQIQTLQQLHERQLAAAQAAARVSGGAVAASYAAPGSTPAAATRVVTLPPQVKVVTLPPATAPATRSGSSHP